jgi:hypothetical protein
MFAGWDAADEEASQAAMGKLTAVMWGTWVPMGLLGALASWLRLRYFTHRVLPKFRQAAGAGGFCEVTRHKSTAYGTHQCHELPFVQAAAPSGRQQDVV